MYVPLRAPIVDADTERYGTFRGGDRVLARRAHEPKSVAAMLALSLLAALLLYASPLAQHPLRSQMMDGATAHNAQPEPLLGSIESSVTRSARVFYRADIGAVNIDFGVVGSAATSGQTSARPDGADAWATFNDSLHAIGWSQLWVNTTELSAAELNDPVRAHQRRCEVMFAAGYAEAALTHRRIDEHFTNVYLTFFPTGDAAEQKALEALRGFLRENLAWMREQVAYYEDATRFGMPDAPYWAAIGSVLAQFDGLVQGYTRFSEKPEPVSEIDLFMLNSDGDLEDLIPAIQRQQQQHTAGATATKVITESFYTFVKNLKCSALIRILPDFADLVWGHATWDTYSSMNRIYKHYELPLPPTDAIGGRLHTPSARRKISMSSSPGYLSSVDDWYLTNAGLGVMETTHGVFDSDLYAFVTTKSVLCWLRSKVANLLGEDGMSWAATFSKFNSGTYNDQWMIIDTKRFVPGTGFAAHGLTVLEQLPGLIHIEDVSSVVNDRGYWGSYNVPYFANVYDLSGFHAAYLSTNESASWSHANCTRAKIFARDAPHIRSLDDLKRVMRYNNWRSDPLSSGHASRAVAARYDLEEDPALFALDGAIDAKATSWSRLQRGQLECDAVSGPTHDQTPVFEWTEALAARAAHLGQPQRFDFAYETMVHDHD